MKPPGRKTLSRQVGADLQVRPSGLKSSATPFMQKRIPVGGGPSGNTWPRWPPHEAQCTSTRFMKKPLSVEVSTACSIGAQKLGHPVPLSYLGSDENSGSPHAAHANVPLPFSSL